MTGGGKGLVVNLGNEIGGGIFRIAGTGIVLNSARTRGGVPSTGAQIAGSGIALTGAVGGAYLAGRAVGVDFWPAFGIAVLSNFVGWLGHNVLDSAGAAPPTPWVAAKVADFGVSYAAGSHWL